MNIAKNSKRKNRLEQLLHLDKEMKHLKVYGISDSLQIVEKETEILKEYIRNIEDTELRELFEDAYLKKKDRVFDADDYSKRKNRILKKSPLKNIYNSAKVDFSKNKLKVLVKQKRNRGGEKQISDYQIEKYISALDDSRYRMILRYYLIHNESDRKIRIKVGYSKNTSIFPPLEKYFLTCPKKQQVIFYD